jgi:spore coat protein H
MALALASSRASFVATALHGAIANPATGTAECFFGVTNLYTFHLTIQPDQWATMEDSDEFKPSPLRPEGSNNGPGGFQPPPPPRNDANSPGVGPRGDGPENETEYKKGTAKLEFQGQPFGAIRVRFKGHSSFRFARHSLKRSLKLDFNDLEPGRTFFGLTKLNLNNNAMDPSQIREALAYYIFRNGGVPAGRTAFGKVFITVPGKYDKAYAGLYTIVEQVDERFLKDRFGTKLGLLLKPERLAGLPYFGDEWAAYTNRVHAKTAVTSSEANRFIEFANCLNSAEDARFQAAVGDYIDVEEFLRFIALEALLSNMDSPLMTSQNYYLYLHPKTGKLVWLPWDLNEAFGGFVPGGSVSEQMDLNLDQPFTRVNRLAERLMQVPGVKDHYHEVVRGLLVSIFSAARLFPVIDDMAATIRPSLANDPMISLPHFEGALSESGQPGTIEEDTGGRSDVRRGGPDGPGGLRWPRPALKAFINQRATSARLQLEGKTSGYLPREIRQGPNGGPRPAGGPPRPPP